MRFHHKFGAKRTELDGIKFSSKREALVYEQLKLGVQSGDVIFFLRQTPFHLDGGVRYICDFVTFNRDGTVHFLDAKGMKTKLYITKKKMVEAKYPIEIEEV